MTRLSLPAVILSSLLATACATRFGLADRHSGKLLNLEFDGAHPEDWACRGNLEGWLRQ
jgi:hypothetical protein